MGSRANQNGQPELSAPEEALLRELLGLVFSPKEAQAACKNLLASLDSLSAIFSAPEAVLRGIPGVTEPAVRAIRLTVELAQRYLMEQTGGARFVFDLPSAVEAMRPKFHGRRTEAVGVLLLDAQGRVLYNGLLSEGSLDEVPLYMRQLLQLCIAYQAEEIYLAHNHPSGVAEPSENDLLMTDRLLSALSDINVHLRDHLVFTDRECYSFVEHGMLQLLRRLVEKTQMDQLERVRKMGGNLNRH